MSVGVSLLAMAVGQSPAMLAGPTPSLASQLPQGFEVYTGFMNIHRVCRSEPARDAGGSVTGDVGWTDAFAGKPAPTGI
jgi:hypothetical protein